MENYLYTTKDTEYKICVYPDECAENPMNYLDGFKTFIDTKFYQYSNNDEIRNFRDFEKKVKKISKSKTCLPIWGYSHSGYTFTASKTNPYDKWDSGLAGYIWSENLSEEELRNIIEEFSLWYGGEAHCVEITNIKTGERDYLGNTFFYKSITLENVLKITLGEGTLKENTDECKY